jgi:oxazoline/thiazoline synthase
MSTQMYAKGGGLARQAGFPVQNVATDLRQRDCIIPSDPSREETDEFLLSERELRFWGKEIYWNVIYNEYRISPYQHLFCSDVHQLFISADEYNTVLEFLTIQYQGSDFASVSKVLGLMSLLIQKEVLVGTLNLSAVFTPSFRNVAFFYFENFQQFNVLSDNKSIADCLKTQCKTWDFAPKATIVVVDDYLDPRLPEIHDRQQAIGRPWIPIQINGALMILGPLFNGSVTTEEVKGFQQVLASNRPIFKWCKEKYNISPFAPILIPANVNDFFLEQIPKLIRLLEDNEITDHLFTIRADSTEIVRNDFNLRNSIIDEKSEICSLEGGYRTCKSEMTLLMLKKEISPFTGVVQAVHCISPENNDLKVYSCSFPKIPLNKDIVYVQDFVQYALGKGISPEQSITSAIAEATERRNSAYDGTESITFGRLADFKTDLLPPNALKQYSEKQFEDFGIHAKGPIAVDRFDPSIPLHWTSANSLVSGKELLVPFTYCYNDTPFEDERYVRFNSNGNAAGNTINEAIIQGFLEIIERDAVAVWWYNRLQRPRINIDVVGMKIISLFEIASNGEWDYWVLDLTTDFEIPVFAAIGKNRKSGRYRFGFGAHFEMHIAIERAISELYQLIVVGNQISPTRFDDIASSFWLEPSGVFDIAGGDLFSNRFKSTQDCLDHCIALVSNKGMDIIYVNTSRRHSLLRTVKVIVPGLCFIWPELGNQRLYTLPAKIGWSKVLQTEIEINPVPLFV